MIDYLEELVGVETHAEDVSEIDAIIDEELS